MVLPRLSSAPTTMSAMEADQAEIRAAELLPVFERYPGARRAAETLLASEFRACSPPCPWPSYPTDGGEEQRNSWSQHWYQFHRGMDPTELHLDPSVCYRLAIAGLLERSVRSRKGSEYRLADPEATRVALSLLTTPFQAWVGPGELERSVPLQLPPDLFAGVIGLDDEKETLRDALTSDTNIILVGPWASAKSLLLDDVARIPSSLLVFGPELTWPGLRDLLFAHRPARVVGDEADKGEHRQEWQAGLLRVSESHHLADVTSPRHRQMQLDCSIFLGANDLGRIDGALRSRCYRVVLRPYELDERRAVIAGFLTLREGVDQELAWQIANMVAPKTADVRQARHVARLSHGDAAKAAFYAARIPEES